MAVKIRLRKHGRRNRPFYRIVVADSRSPRDGKYVECIGWYNPFESDMDKYLNVEEARVAHWLEHGAQMSENVESLLKRRLPDLIKSHHEKALALRAKMTKAKRDLRRKKAAAK